MLTRDIFEFVSLWSKFRHRPLHSLPPSLLPFCLFSFSPSLLFSTSSDNFYFSLSLSFSFVSVAQTSRFVVVILLKRLLTCILSFLFLWLQIFSLSFPLLNRFLVKSFDTSTFSTYYVTINEFNCFRTDCCQL